MQATATTRDATLDLLRSWSITHVILFHVLHGLLRFAPEQDVGRIIADYPWWMNFTWQPIGVDIIFVVSAYLLTLGLLREMQSTNQIDLKRYMIRRVSRIIPLYYIAVLLFALGQGNSVSDVILALLFVEFLITGSAIVPVGWTMELMMYVYIALPAVAYGLIKSKRPFLWLGIAIAASIAIRFVPLWGKPEVATTLFTHLLERDGVMAEANDLYFKPWNRLTPFLIGIGLAAIQILRPDLFQWFRKARITILPLAATMILFALFLPIHNPLSWIYAQTGPTFWLLYWTTNGALFALATALIIAAQHGTTLRIPGPWATISRNIMGVYLFHMPMILIGAVIVFRSTDEAILGTATVWHVIGIFLVALILSLGLAAVLNRFVEGPTQRWLRHRFNA